jgi:hypothetical protein
VSNVDSRSHMFNSSLQKVVKLHSYSAVNGVFPLDSFDSKLILKVCNRSKRSGYYIYPVLRQPVSLYFAYTVYRWVLYDSYCKQRLFP